MLLEIIEDVINQFTKDTQEVNKLFEEIITTFDKYQNRIYHKENPCREPIGSYRSKYNSIYKRYMNVGGVHLELGSGPSWRKELLTDYIDREGLSEVIRLDFNIDFDIEIVAHATELPFLDNSIDRIGANYLFEHVAYPHEVLKESFRILRPGGMLFINVPFIFPRHQFPYDFLRFTPDFFKHVCGHIGFGPVFADVSDTYGAYYTLHNALKGAIVMEDIANKENEAMRIFHILTMFFLALLIPFDRYFMAQGSQLAITTNCIAIKPGFYIPSHRPKRNIDTPFLERNLDLLADPISKQPLNLIGNSLFCKASNIYYPIKKGIPIFIYPNNNTYYQPYAEVSMRSIAKNLLYHSKHHKITSDHSSTSSPQVSPVGILPNILSYDIEHIPNNDKIIMHFYYSEPEKETANAKTAIKIKSIEGDPEDILFLIGLLNKEVPNIKVENGEK